MATTRGARSFSARWEGLSDRAQVALLERVFAALSEAFPGGVRARVDRARGWGVALICGAACALPMGARLRGLLTEILVEAPETLRPELALDTAPEPLLGRVRATNNSGIAVTALNAKSPAHAGMLIALGFDRGEY